MIMKGRSPTMRHVSRTHRVALDWLFDRITLDPKIQIKYIETKNQLAEILTKGNFTRDEWNHLLTLFNISHFSSTACTAAMAKRAQQESGEGRVNAFVRSCLLQPHQTRGGPRMDIEILENLFQVTIERGNLWNRQDQIFCKRIMVDLGLLKSGKVKLQSPIDRGNLREFLGIHCKKVDSHREEPLLGRNAHSARYGELMHDRTGKPVSVHHKEQAYFENFVMGSDAAEYVNKVKDQVQNRQKRMSNVAESGDEHSIIWGMFMATTLNAATFMGKNFSTIQSVVKNHESLTLKQMFDVSAQFVNNQEEINCLDKILHGKNSWTRLSLIDDEIVINL